MPLAVSTAASTSAPTTAAKEAATSERKNSSSSSAPKSSGGGGVGSSGASVAGGTIVNSTSATIEHDSDSDAFAGCDPSVRTMLGPTLRRLTGGLPRHELDVIVKEARACEDAL